MPFHDAALQQVIPVLRISSLEGFAGAAHRSTNSCGVLVYTKYVPRRTDDAVPPSPRAGCVTTVYLHPGVDTCTNVLFSLSRCFLCSPFTTSYTHDTHTHIFSGALTTRSVPTHYVLQILSWSCSRIWSRVLVYGTRTNIQ